MVPAVAILLMRAAEGRGPLRVYLPLVPALAVSLFVSWADYELANSARTAARAIWENYSGTGGKLWFQGHWGFQYYMEESGASPVDSKASGIYRGSLVAVPLNNTGLNSLPDRLNKSVIDRYYFPAAFMATMPHGYGAGYYTSVWGALPFMLSPRFGETYIVFQVNEDWTQATRPESTGN
jgi:hypothetical protein